AIDVAQYTNTILVGSAQPLSAGALSRNLDAFPETSPLHVVAGWSLTSGNMRAIQPGGLVFTDDRAPVELVIDQMILDAAREISGP
nr:spermine synthase [Chloroflexia bacterium]